MATLTDAARVRAFTDPIEFQRRVLKRRIWGAQEQIARALDEHRHVAVKGCHASGKTYLMAGMVIHALVRWKEIVVVTVAPTLRQVKTHWKDIAIAREQCAVALPEPATTSLEISRDRYAIGVSSSKGVNVQGFHGKRVLVVIDEAPGVGPDIRDAIEGIRAGGDVRVLEMGNPVVPSGGFYDCFGRRRASVHCITISAFDTPNLAGLNAAQLTALPEDGLDCVAFPGLTTRRWVRDRLRDWGPNNPRWHSRVLGEFPTQSEYAVFSITSVEQAGRDPTEKEMELAARCPQQIGIDVAGAGADETALCARAGGVILHQQAWADADPRGAVVAVLGRLKAQHRGGPTIVVVDTVGIGYNFALHLRDQGFDVRGFQAGSAPIDQIHYANAKAEAFFTARDYFKSGEVSGLEDEETKAQLEGILYRETPRGLIEVESKDAARKRGVSSPDRAEALVMAFCRLQMRGQYVVLRPLAQISPI